jgi:hypothetical protein
MTPRTETSISKSNNLLLLTEKGTVMETQTRLYLPFGTKVRRRALPGEPADRTVGLPVPVRIGPQWHQAAGRRARDRSPVDASR